MKGHTVFIRSSTTRKPQFQLMTLFEKSSSSLTVLKRSANPAAVPHLQSFATKRTSLLNAGITCDVANVTESSPSEIAFKFIDGVSLETKFYSALTTNDEQAIKSILDRAFKVIDSLPTVKTNPVDNAGFRNVFGNFYKGNYECITPGCVDFNLDNLIENNTKLTLIDYEWVFDFPVPKEFIKLRVLHHAFLEARTEFLKSHPRQQVVFFNDSLYVPKNYFDKYESLFKHAEEYLLSNLHFLNYLQISQADLKVTLNRRTMLAGEVLELATPYSTNQPRIFKELTAKIERIKELDDTVREQQVELNSNQQRISRLEHTLTYKLLQRAEIRIRNSLRRRW